MKFDFNIWKKANEMNYTGSITDVIPGLEIELFYFINGKQVNKKEWSNYLFNRKLEDFINE